MCENSHCLESRLLNQIFPYGRVVAQQELQLGEEVRVQVLQGDRAQRGQFLRVT